MKRILFIIIFLAAAFSSFAEDNLFSRPSVPTLVADNAQVFTDNERWELTSKLNKFSRESSTQILVYTTTDLHGYDIADFGQRLGEGWGVGQNGFDNGIVIVYKPKTQTEYGEVTIQTGYGIEPLIPDATCKRIITQEMIPNFRQGLEYKGIDKAVDVCISLTKGDFTANDYSGSDDDDLSVGSIIFFIICFLVGYVLYAAYGQFTVGRRPSFFSYLWFVLSLIGNSSSSGGKGGSSRSSGFGGYGGGHFGGGGASGRW
jgi:uncharacterized protein